MTVSGMEAWRDTEAYKEYKEYHDKQDWASETVREISNRALRVIKGEASESERKKVNSYIARHSKQNAGEQRFGSGKGAVSAHTAGLRNWGYDPTGRFT